MTVGGRCGKRHSSTIESFKPSKGQRELSNGRKLSLLLAIPPVFPLLLNLLLCLSTYLLLLLPNLYRRQRLLLLPLRLLYQKPRSPVPVTLPLGANARPVGSGETPPLKDQAR